MVKSMMRYTLLTLCLLAFTPIITAHASVLPSMIDSFIAQGAHEGDPQAGETLWKKKFYVEGKARSCQTCHTADLTRSGSHARTGKIIEPMALSVNTNRFNEKKKVNKWLRRNCKWVMGQECSLQEKVDILLFLQQQ